MALRVQGLSSPSRAAVASGSEPEATAARLEAAAKEGLVAERTGRVGGFTLTPEGATRLDGLLAAEGLRADPGLTDGYERFLMLNERVLRVCSDWQVRREHGIESPNDHSDPSYDDSVIDRLCELHERAKTVVDMLAARAPRYGVYRSRLDDCAMRLQNGDRTAFTAPLAESYHTVWFELHQDLLLTLGLERES
jgi:hypothetical protein